MYLFDFNKTIYGCYLEVEFLHKLREEIHFNSVIELVEQMCNDVREAKRYHLLLSRNSKLLNKTYDSLVDYDYVLFYKK